jgi:hypothetical protein
MSAWIDAYAGAFSTCTVIEGHNEMFLPFMGRDLGPDSGDFVRFSENEFFGMLADRSVVFTSAYAPDLQRYHDEGHLSALWAALGVTRPMRSLKTLQAPFSIWPYYPDEGWAATFEQVAAEAEAAIEETGADVFLASAGCYGMPLVAHVSRRFPHVLALNYGHHVNTCFGVKSNNSSILDARGIKAPDIPLVASKVASSYPAVIARADLARYA